MALPQQVVEQLNQGSRRTPGWSSGILLFSGSILFIVLFIYAGLRLGYEPYLNAQLSAAKSQAQKVGQSVSAADEANLITFYSQINNIQSLIKNHVFFSQFLTWLERTTEANVYYTSMFFTSGNQITLAGVAKTSADVAEQITAFEADPRVSSVALSNSALSPSGNNWIFNVVLTMQPSVFLWSPGTSSAGSAVTPASATTTPAATNTTTTP
jgi:type IV pilus assembly PilN-like protein